MIKKMVLLLAALLISANLANAAPAPDSKGTDFWLAFPQNHSGTPALTLFITGDTATTGTVSIAASSALPAGFLANFSVTPGVVTSVVIPPAAQLVSTDTVENKGIHVTSAAEVTVYGLNRIPFTTDAYLALPTDILGTDYIVLTYSGGGSQLAVVGTVNGTTVMITPSAAAGVRPAGTQFPITLNQGQTYQLRASGGDLSGTFITSDQPIAVFGGNQCTNIPPGFSACDHIIEQLPPTVTWGKSFVTVPLATRLRGDTFRFLASTDGTQITLNGSVVATLNRGQFHERIIDVPSVITSNNPILVAQYSNGSGFDGVTSDPFMMLIPSFEQFLGSYTVTTPASGFGQNFINVAAPNAAVGSISLDGSPIPAGSFTPIGSTGFSGAKLSVSLGTHNLSGPLPFGAFMYGFASFDSYGYPGGLSLAPIARVTGLSLAPKTATNPVGTQHCLIAAVSDQNEEPLEGVRVDFDVSGANVLGGFANTAANGEAQFCYTGENPGQDTIEASVGDIADTATKDWTSEGNTPPVADPQSVTVAEDTLKAITLTGSDADNDSLTFIIVTPPQHGTLSEFTAATKAQLTRARRQLKARLRKESKMPPKQLAALIQSTTAKTIAYAPDLNYNGPDSFTFVVNDGTTDSAPVTVNITVTPEPDPPEIQNLRFARRIYSTPGIAALLEFRDVDGDSPITLKASLTARNVPKGCGSDVLPSDPASINFSEDVNGPDGDPFNFEQAEVKALEIGPQAMKVAQEHGCHVTLELTNFSIQGVDPTGRTSNTLSGSFSIDSNNGSAALVATAATRQLRSTSAAKKIAPPVVR